MIEKILERARAELLNLTFHKSERCKGFNDGIHTVMKIVKEESKNGGWIPCSSGQMPSECEEVNVTIEDNEGDVYTTTSWLQEGVWVVKKTALQPKVIAWKPKDAPYQKGE